MKNAPTVKSWKSLLKYLLDNKADKGRHESDALPGLIKAITRMQDQGEAFTADPRELWKRINSRPSDVTNENAPLRSDLEDDTVNPSRGGGAFPRRQTILRTRSGMEAGRPSPWKPRLSRRKYWRPLRPKKHRNKENWQVWSRIGEWFSQVWPPPQASRASPPPF